MNEETAITVDDLRQKALADTRHAEAEAREPGPRAGNAARVALRPVIVRVSVAYYAGVRVALAARTGDGRDTMRVHSVTV